MLRNYIKITWKILKRKKLYTLITLAGIIIPVVLIIIISSFLVHINNYKPPVSDFKNVIYLDWVIWKNILENGEVRVWNENPATLHFINKYVKTLKTQEKVAVVSVIDWAENETIYMEDKSLDVFIKYTDTVFWEITDFQFIYGRPYTIPEYKRGDRLIVTDQKTCSSLFGQSNPVGKTIEIDNTGYRIIGVVKDVDRTIYRIAANIYIPFSCTDNYRSKAINEDFCYALVLLNNKRDFKAAEREFQQKLTRLDFSEIPRLEINTVIAKLEKNSLFMNILRLLQHFFHYDGEDYTDIYIYGILMIFLLLFFPAINLIYINISRFHERLTEIGIRKTFGSTVLNLFSQLLLENILITLIGGIISFIFSIIIIEVINGSGILEGIHLQFNYLAMLVSLLLIFALGILSGLLPSIILSKSKIVNSLNRL